MASKRGNLSINSENMFPIIKKWLYSDHDIFYREVVSNACDAITKSRKMDMMGELSNHVIDNLAAALDVVIPDGDLDSRADQLKVCVRTRARYESTRLRG